jgi:hypothetical protein
MRNIILFPDFYHNTLSHEGVLIAYQKKTLVMSIFLIAVISYFVLFIGFVFLLRKKAKLLPDDFED